MNESIINMKVIMISQAVSKHTLFVDLEVNHKVTMCWWLDKYAQYVALMHTINDTFEKCMIKDTISQL